MTKLWGGRFKKKTHDLVEKFTRSIQYDYKLAEYDCIGSLIHIKILKSADLLTSDEFSRLNKGLKKILTSIKKEEFKIDPTFEDIHSYIQHLLKKNSETRNAALKLHTCRSRNDQVVFDMKVFCKTNVRDTQILLKKFELALLHLMRNNLDTFIPGYTHLQHAIPIFLAEHIQAYVEMLERDGKRLENALKNTEVTLGAGALAGTIIDATKYNQATTKIFNETINVKATGNSIDAVSSRDFVIEILSALAILQMHLSRLAEDMILWASKEFGFIDIDDAFCTGSSLMPQKKNPDVLELVRGYSGRMTGNLVNVLVMMKGLPLAYNRDMQLDKEPLFDSFEIVQQELKVLAELFKNVKFDKANIDKQLDDESLYATDLTDYLVKNKVPFKEAHAIIGRLIRFKYKGKKEISLKDLNDEKLQTFHPLLTQKVLRKIMNPQTSVRSKKSVRRTKPKFRHA